MIPSTPDQEKREAFRLFEDGRYRESLQCCSHLLESERDPALEVLYATNLYYTGRLDDAEVSFRDLAQKMPDSSYVHSYLAKVLEEKGDEAAIAEYALAVHLDPTNADALRSYAAYMLSRGDCRGALPVLRRLVYSGRNSADARNLVRALIEIGNAEEALSTHAEFVNETAQTDEYINALLLAQDYRKASIEALEGYRQSGKTELLRKHLAALARFDPDSALAAYEEHSRNTTDNGVLADYALLLSQSGKGEKALQICSRLLTTPASAEHRLLACDLNALHGSRDNALSMYENLIMDELRQKNDLALIGMIIGNYRQFISRSLPVGEALARFLALVSRDVNTPGLLETARFYEDLKNPAEARSWYYRAYRADFLNGGLEYARFLAQNNDMRECEKVMLYILSNVKRSQDINRVAAVIVDKGHPLHRMHRLMDHLIRRLDERRMSLTTEGLELLSIAFLIAAKNALDESDYATCKRFCLRGIDVLPAHTRSIRPDDFISLVTECKEHAIADRPVIDQPVMKRSATQAPALGEIMGELDLDEKEQQILGFLHAHKKATELELRKALSNRRIAGIVNRLIQKAAAKNMTVIVKKGLGDEGEVYEYGGI